MIDDYGYFMSKYINVYLLHISYLNKDLINLHIIIIYILTNKGICSKCANQNMK